MRVSRMSNSPRSGASVPHSTFINVDLPAPLWPTRPMHSPRASARSTPRRACTAPKDLAASLTLSNTFSPSLQLGDEVDHFLLGVFDVDHAARLGGLQRGVQRVLRDHADRQLHLLWHLGTRQDLLRDPEREGR